MASSLPFALRVAVGLVSETLGALRRLPKELTTLPVTVIGQVAKLSFQLNQQLAELATEGDHLLASLHRPGDPPERTAWSTIDDENEVAAKDPQAAATWDSLADATANGSGDAIADHRGSAAKVARGFGRPTAVADSGRRERDLLEDLEFLEGTAPAGRPVPPSPDGLAGHNSLTLAQLRARVRGMPVEQVRAALEHEQADLARPAFLTILSNRLATLARETSE
jgi:hypothetical protein